MIHTFAYVDKIAGVCVCGAYFKFHGAHPARVMHTHILDSRRNSVG